MATDIQKKIQLWIKDLMKGDKSKVNFLIILGIAGMLLLAISAWLPTGKKDGALTAKAEAESQASNETFYATQLEERLQGLIENLQGAGKTRVLVTLEASARTVYALDTDTDGENSRATHVLIDDPVAPALIESVQTPAIQGVAVLCEGGDRATIQAEVTEIVTVLTGVGASHIAVGKSTD